MANSPDFRKRPFAVKHVKDCAGYVGRTSYARLYLVENVLRVVIHSVLFAQVGQDWWNRAVDQAIRNEVDRFKKQYLSRPWHTKPGAHDIYFTHLKHLSEIIRSNRIHFDRIVTDVDQWIVEIERIRLPRNIVGHMNYPSDTDRKRIEVFLSDCLALVRQFTTSQKVPLKIP